MAKRTIAAVRVCADRQETTITLDNGDVLHGVISAGVEVSTDSFPTVKISAVILNAVPEGRDRHAEAESDIRRGARMTDHRFRLNPDTDNG